MIKVGEVYDLDVSLLPSSLNCWGKDSLISLNSLSGNLSDKVQFYLGQAPYTLGSSVRKEVLDPTKFRVKALKANIGWDDIKICAKGTPKPQDSSHSHAECESEPLYLVAYHVTGADVMEKPWGGDWNVPENKGTRTVDGETRNWYHLW